MKTLLAAGLFSLAVLPSLPASAFSLTPTDQIGNVRTYTNDPYLYISSGMQA